MTYTVITAATSLGLLVVLTNVTVAEDNKPEQPKVCGEGYALINGECVKRKTYDFDCAHPETRECKENPSPDARRPTPGTSLTGTAKKR